MKRDGLLRQLPKMARWARNPPSTRRVVIGAVVLAVCLALAGVEYVVGWPDWLTLAE